MSAPFNISISGKIVRLMPPFLPVQQLWPGQMGGTSCRAARHFQVVPFQGRIRVLVGLVPSPVRPTAQARLAEAAASRNGTVMTGVRCGEAWALTASSPLDDPGAEPIP